MRLFTGAGRPRSTGSCLPSPPHAAVLGFLPSLHQGCGVPVPDLGPLDSAGASPRHGVQHCTCMGVPASQSRDTSLISFFSFHSTPTIKLSCFTARLCVLSPAAGLPGQRGGNACQAAPFAPSCCGWWERPELPAFGPKSRFSPEGRLPSGVGGLPARLARHLQRTAPAWPLSCVPVPARLGQGWIIAPGEYLGVSSPEGRCVPLPCWLPRVPVLSQLSPYSLPRLRPCLPSGPAPSRGLQHLAPPTSHSCRENSFDTEAAPLSGAGQTVLQVGGWWLGLPSPRKPPVPNSCAWSIVRGRGRARS